MTNVVDSDFADDEDRPGSPEFEPSPRVEDPFASGIIGGLLEARPSTPLYRVMRWVVLLLVLSPLIVAIVVTVISLVARFTST